MNTNSSELPAKCPHCGSQHIIFKNKAALWECQDCEERFSGPAIDVAVRRLSDRAARPKEVFFSYGHDYNKELVVLFQADLEKRGHKVWFDAKDIGVWDDWKGRITRGIDSSELAIAFMSAHSIRENGVCQNEIAIAMNRFGTVYPVLLEAGIENDVPVTVRHLQWPDLSQWKAIKEGRVPGLDWNRWYEEKLISLVEKLEGEATDFADETNVLRKTLQPASFEAKISQHVPGFVGREWIFEAYNAWVDRQPESRLFWIKAGPGVGKSAIAANLAHRKRAAIAASWFCDAKSSELKNPDTALKSIAFQLALRWEDYRVRLLRKLQLGLQASDELCDSARKELGKKNTHDLFNFLLAEPMASLIWREHKLVVVVDALDEATDEQGRNRIVEMIGNELNSLPGWLGFVVTSRPEAEVINRLQGFKPFEIDAQDFRNLADLRSWYQTSLARRPELGELTPPEQKRIEDLLIERSQGMILYLKIVEEGLKEGSLAARQLEKLSPGLPGLFRRYYDSFQYRFGNDYETNIKPLLRLLYAAGGPLPEDLAREVLEWNDEQFLASRNRLGSYVIERSEGYELFHKTLSEWLGDKTSGPFYLDGASGKQQIADVLFLEFKHRDIYSMRWRKLLQAWVPAWMPELTQNEDASLLHDLGKALKNWAVYAGAEAFFRRALAINEQRRIPECKDTVEIIIDLTDLLLDTDNFGEAGKYIDDALAILLKSEKKDSLEYGRLLVNRGRALIGKGNLPEAESSFDKAIGVLQQADKKWGKFHADAVFWYFLSIKAQAPEFSVSADKWWAFNEKLAYALGFLRAVHEARYLACMCPAYGEPPFSDRLRASVTHDLAVTSLIMGLINTSGEDYSRYKEANRYFGEAINIFGKTNDIDYLAKSRWARGYVRGMLGEKETATEDLNEAHKGIVETKGESHPEAKLVEDILCALHSKDERDLMARDIQMTVMKFSFETIDESLGSGQMPMRQRAF